MVIEDLRTTCPRCRGSGRLAGITNLGISQANVAGACPTCAGRGFNLTELGQDVLNWLRPFVQEMIAEAVPKAPPEKKAEPEGQN